MNRAFYAIGNIFAEIQDAGSVNNKMIYGLIEEFVENPNNFLRGMEQCYLKICKVCTRTHKKQLEKFEKITEKFFQIFSQEVKNPANKNIRLEENDVYGVLQHLLNFLCEGLEAPSIIVRQICAKHISRDIVQKIDAIMNLLGIMLKVFSKEDFETILDEKVLANLNQGNVSLLKNKQPSLKLLGLKIASYIQDFESDEVQQEVVNIITLEENRDIRKVAIINLKINENTLPPLLSRTRDIDSELRILVYKKLIKHKVHLINLKLIDTYKIVYDGLFAREEGVQEQCAAYLREVYYMFEPPRDENSSENKANELLEEPRQVYQKIKTEISRFLKIFQIQKALAHPEIYELMEIIIIQAIKFTIRLDKLEIYLREFIKSDLKQHKLLNAHPEEILFIRVACQFVIKHPTEFPSLNTLIEDLFPSLAELSKIIDKFYGKSDLLSTYQTILLTEMLLNSDETGRQALISTLRSILLDTNMKLSIADDEEAQEEYNDVFPEKTEKMLQLESYSQSFLDTPIIRSVNDLVPVIVRVLRKLLGDQNNGFSTLLLETISIIREPVEKSQELERNELLEEKKRLTKHIDYYNYAIREIEDKLQLPKKATKQQQQVQTNEVLEVEKSALELERKAYLEKLKEIDGKTSSINIRCLNIACSLLEGCKLSLTDPGIMGLLGSFIGPCFQEANSLVKDLSFKCLSLYLLLDKHTCADYMKVYKNLIDEHYERNESVPSLLTAIKACFDFFVVFKFGVEEDIIFDNDDDEHFEAQDVLESLNGLMFNGDIITKKICVEGFCKLLFNNKVKNPVQMLSLLMLIWVNPNQTLNEGTKIIQILSMFFKAYTPYSYDCLKNSEQAIEVLIELLYLVSDSKDLEFNQELSTFVLNEDFFTMVLRTSLSLMKKEEYNFSDDEATQDKISPLERFLIFLVLFSFDGGKVTKPYRKVLARHINQFETEKMPPFNKKFLGRFMSEISEDKEGHAFQEFLKKLQVKEEDPKLTEDQDEELNQIDKKIVEEIKKSKIEAKQLVKYLLAYKVLVRRDKNKPQEADLIEVGSISSKAVRASTYVQALSEMIKIEESANSQQGESVKVKKEIALEDEIARTEEVYFDDYERGIEDEEEEDEEERDDELDVSTLLQKYQEIRESKVSKPQNKPLDQDKTEHEQRNNGKQHNGQKKSKDSLQNQRKLDTKSLRKDSDDDQSSAKKDTSKKENQGRKMKRRASSKAKDSAIKSRKRSRNEEEEIEKSPSRGKRSTNSKSNRKRKKPSKASKNDSDDEDTEEDSEEVKDKEIKLSAKRVRKVSSSGKKKK